MRRIVYQPASASSGGGGAPTVGSLVVGPEYGEVNKPALAAHVAMGAAEFAANRTVGAAIRLLAAEFSGGHSVGATVGFDGNFTNNRSVAAHVALTDAAFSGGRSVGAQVLMPAAAFANDRSVSAHLGATYLGAPNFQTIATVAQTAGSTTVVITKPSGTVEGDLLVACIGSSTVSSDEVITPPSGWTEIQHTAQVAALGANLTTWYRVAGAAEGANYTWTGANAGTAHIGWIMRIDSVDSATPINVSSENSGNATDPVALGVTTTASNCLRIVCCAQANNLAASYTPPANHIERSDLTSTAFGTVQCTGESATRVQAATGASGNQTMDSTQLAASSYCAHHIAIAPGTKVLQA